MINLIQFQGVRFNLSGDWFLTLLQQNGLLDGDRNLGQIVYADDQFINQQSMQLNFEDIGLGDKLTLYSNGQDVVQHFDDLLKKQSLIELPCQPVTLLLLDIQMPIMNGIQTMKLVKEKFARFNEELKLKQMTGKSLDDVVLRPLICYLSHYDKESMLAQMTVEE